jgi:hypothetical protein
MRNKVSYRYHSDAQNAEDAAISAKIAVFPLNCLADTREQGADVTFYVGGRLAGCH